MAAFRLASLAAHRAPLAAAARRGARGKAGGAQEASSVAAPTWVDMLRSVRKLERPSPVKFIGCLNEILSAALRAKQTRDLLEDRHFQAFLDRLSARLFGFSGKDTYLILASLLKVPSSPPSCALVASCLELLGEELEGLGGVQLGHVGLLLALAGEACPGEAPQRAVRELWPLYASELQTRSPRLGPKGLCLAAAGLARGRQHCSAPLLECLAEATTRHLERLSPEQLSGLMLSLASLSYQDGEVFSASAEQLGLMADELGPKQVGVGLLALAMVGAPEATRAGLLQQSRSMVHFSSPGEALHTLRALSAVGDFTVELVLPLLAQVCKVPRSMLSDAEDQGLHQVMLSLLHEPAAAPALAAVQADPELWESCYQPEEVPREASAEAAEDVGAAALAEELARARGWAATPEAPIADFYRAPLLLELPRGRAVVDVDPDAQPWLSRPADVWRRLKHRHLSLWGWEVFWVKRSEWLLLDELARRRAVESWLSSKAA